MPVMPAATTPATASATARVRANGCGCGRDNGNWRLVRVEIDSRRLRRCEAGRRNLVARELLHGRNEAIAAARDRDDELVIGRMIVESFAKCRDVAREVVFLDDRVGPDELEQDVLVDDLPSPLDKGQQHFERLQRENDMSAVLTQRTRRRIGDKGAERVNLVHLNLLFGRIIVPPPPLSKISRLC